MKDARAQVDLWIATVRETVQTIQSLNFADQPQDEAALLTMIRHELTRADPVYARLADLPDDIRTRERDFTNQTLRGILGHLRG